MRNPSPFDTDALLVDLKANPVRSHGGEIYHWVERAGMPYSFQRLIQDAEKWVWEDAKNMTCSFARETVACELLDGVVGP